MMDKTDAIAVCRVASKLGRISAAREYSTRPATYMVSNETWKIAVNPIRWSLEIEIGSLF
jgi:hypothetical protein